jgi:hypothetical protein
MVIDLEVSGLRAADLEQISLPQPLQLRRARARGCAERGVILRHDGERRGERKDHCDAFACEIAPATAPSTGFGALASPMRLEPMNLPDAGSGAMMT